MAYKTATRYAEQQMCLATSDFKVFVTRLEVRWLHTVEAEKPVQLIGRPERVEPMAQSATSLMRRTVNPLIVQGTPFLLIFGAIMISAWYGGLGPGLLATFTGGLAADYFSSHRRTPCRGSAWRPCRFSCSSWKGRSSAC